MPKVAAIDFQLKKRINKYMKSQYNCGIELMPYFGESIFRPSV